MVRIGGDDLKEQVIAKQVTPAGETIERATTPGETMVTLNNATLHSFKLMATGLGFDIHLTVPIGEADKLPALTRALQKVCDVHVTRYSRRARRVESPYEEAYRGTED